MCVRVISVSVYSVKQYEVQVTMHRDRFLQ